ncbi:MAG TPA: hypothetical protein VGF23_05170 [Gaiellaceae bacterium]|jgi:hypothetical protein
MRRPERGAIVAAMDGEIFWSILAWGLVIGGAVLSGAIGYYWFVVLPKRLVPDPVAAPTSQSSARSQGEVGGPAWR